MKKNISIIAAVSDNSAIGVNNTIPWRCPEDMKMFKQLTTGNVIIMGRKTHESIGKSLPNRTTIIVTRNKDLKIDGCLTANSIESAINLCDGDIFICGGYEIYKAAMQYADIMYITEIHKLVLDADAFFPQIDTEFLWDEMSRIELSQEVPERLSYDFVTYIRKY